MGKIIFRNLYSKIRKGSIRNMNFVLKQNFYIIVLIITLTRFFIFIDRVYAMPGWTFVDEEGNIGSSRDCPEGVASFCQTACGPGTVNNCAQYGISNPPCALYAVKKETRCYIPDPKSGAEILREVRIAWELKEEYQCSTADKLQAGAREIISGTYKGQRIEGTRKDGYLAWGNGTYDPNLGYYCYSGSFYKVCCDSEGKVAPSVAYPFQDGYWPEEGWCGGKTWKRIYSDSETNIPVGQKHPRCEEGAISCTTQVSGNQVTFTANSTQTGTIKISIGNRVVRTCTNTNTCSYTTTGSGNITANATLEVNNQVVASTTCQATLGGGTPLPGNPPTPPRYGGICSPYIANRISYPNSTSQFSSAGQVSKLNSPSSGPEVKKGDNLYLDVSLQNAGVNANATCKYKNCVNYQKGWCVYINKNVPSAGCRWTCNYSDVLTSGSCGSCSGSAPNCWCNAWSNETYTETITNPSRCSVRSPGVTIRVSIEDLRKFFDVSLNLNNSFSVNPETNISNSSITLSSMGQWARSLTPPWDSFISPLRHGYFYLRSEKISGSIYNVPDTITRSDSMDRNYVDCEECTWSGGGWSCRFAGVDKGSYTIFNESSPSNPRFVRGLDPLNVPWGRIEFYVKPTTISMSLNLDKPNINHPSDIRTQKRDYIVGYGFNINYSLTPNGNWGNDKGMYELKVNGSTLFSGNRPESGNYYYTPLRAGSYTFDLCHNFDEQRHSRREAGEAYRGDGFICTSQNITVYRYVCGQGFCWECNSEPDFTNLKASCNIVETAKCEAYIGSDCRAKGRE